MKFCNQCGAAGHYIIPPGDNRDRFVCKNCGHIQYANPRIIAGCLPIYEDQVLLCKRAIEPRYGLWTLPAGFMENGESTLSGALREAKEEANLTADPQGLYTVFSLPHISQVYMFYRVRMLDMNFSAGEESLDVRLYEETEIPWDQLSFQVINQTLEHYFEDRKTGVFPVHEATLDRSTDPLLRST